MIGKRGLVTINYKVTALPITIRCWLCASITPCLPVLIRLNASAHGGTVFHKYRASESAVPNFHSHHQHHHKKALIQRRKTPISHTSSRPDTPIHPPNFVLPPKAGFPRNPRTDQCTDSLRLTMSECLSVEDQFFNNTLGYCFALSILVPILEVTISWYLDLGLRPEVGISAWLLAIGWTFPAAFYILYHPVTLPLPTWLTSGHPVTFGGIIPDVCNNPTLTLQFGEPGGWPCFPSQLKDRFANLSGPDGWKYLTRLDARMQLCIFFFVFNVGVITTMVFWIRKPRFDSKRACETCRNCGQKRVGKASGEKSDCEKQQ